MTDLLLETHTTKKTTKMCLLGTLPQHNGSPKKKYFNSLPASLPYSNADVQFEMGFASRIKERY